MPLKGLINSNTTARELTQREKDILRTIIHLYILNAAPVGSRILSKYLEYELKLSPATIRNVMADLEELEYISHPHTSAGRVPTDKGYRFYVDSLMNIEKLSESEIRAVEKHLAGVDSESVLKDASKILGLLSKYLGIVEIPHLSNLKVIRIELISLSATTILVVLALDSNIVRTVTLEANFEVDLRNLDKISSLINERISNKTLKFIKENFAALFQSTDFSSAPLIRLFVDSVDKLFTQNLISDRIHIAGANNLLSIPEFEDMSRIKSVIELIENEDIIIHILDKTEIGENNVRILIGSEMENNLMEDYSLILSNYSIGSACGSIGLIGPKRMNYSKMTSLVRFVSEYVSQS